MSEPDDGLGKDFGPGCFVGFLLGLVLGASLVVLIFRGGL